MNKESKIFFLQFLKSSLEQIDGEDYVLLKDKSLEYLIELIEKDIKEVKKT
nr:MAG: hypothetical protein [uncultured archaeon]